MTKNITFDLADTGEMKKPHACQTNNWEDPGAWAPTSRLKCMGCGHVVMMPRADFNKKVQEAPGQEQ